MFKNRLYLMIGCPGCGKSFLAEKMQDSRTVWVSRDKIRFSLLKGKDAYFSQEDKVFKTFVGEINKNLKEGKDVIADATHLNRTSRSKLLSKLYLTNVQVIAMFFSVSLDWCLQNNATRTGRAKVPEDALIDMYNRLEPVTPYEPLIHFVATYKPEENSLEGTKINK